jgi:hypothetical protein
MLRALAKGIRHKLRFQGPAITHEQPMILAPLFRGLVALVGEAVRVPRCLLAAGVPAIAPPCGRIAPIADDETGMAPAASNRSARRFVLVLAHARAP